MISEQEARQRILENVSPLAERTVPLASALHCFAAQEYRARLPLPVFDNSAMDGYAVVANSAKKGARLRVTGEQPAGRDRKLRVCPGETVRIFTGAPIPGGADSVIMQEDVTRLDDDIVVNTDVAAGEFVRSRGCDLAEGQTILGKGARIGAAQLALLASQGFNDVAIGGEVSAAILSTGDELVIPGGALEPGQIYESNSTLIGGLLRNCGAIARSQRHCRDNRESLIEALEHGTRHHVLIITGGVSVGEHDLVQDALRELGAQIDIWRVAVKPGKPFLFGTVENARPSPQSSRRSARSRRPEADATAPGEGAATDMASCFVFGLPGNPVSAFVTFLQFVRPAILKMMGATNFDLTKVPVRLSMDLTNDSDRPHYIRGKVDCGTFTPIGRQESHALFGLSQSNALLRIGVGERLKAGQLVDVQMWE